MILIGPRIAVSIRWKGGWNIKTSWTKTFLYGPLTCRRGKCCSGCDWNACPRAWFNEATMMQEPQLNHRRLFRDLDHPETGANPYTGHLFSIRRYDSGPRFSAPLLGQHNEQVLKEILRLSDNEITEAVIAEALD